MSVQDIFELGIRGVLFFLPAYIANASALIFKGRVAMDFGKIFIDGKPILGSGKTFRGFFMGIIVGTLTGILIGIPASLSFSTSLGALIGDLVGAFIKRRLSMKPGDPAPVLDQFDFIFGAAFISRSWVSLDPRSIIIVMALTPLIHLISNSIAFLIGIKRVPW